MADKKKSNLPEDTGILSNEELGQIELTLEDDTTLLCDIIATFPCSNGRSYVALLPVDDPDSDFFLYRYTVNGEDFELEDIEDDDEFEAATDAFDELIDNADFDEMFSEEDEEDGQ